MTPETPEREPDQEKLEKSVKVDVERIERAKKERTTVLAQSVYMGTLGLIFILPVVVGAYLGNWLDRQFAGYQVRWTVSLIVLGLAVGAVNVYLFMRER